jgi:hypothetical protein
MTLPEDEPAGRRAGAFFRPFPGRPALHTPPSKHTNLMSDDKEKTEQPAPADEEKAPGDDAALTDEHGHKIEIA